MTFSLRRLISLAFLLMLAACGTSTTGTSSTVPASGTSAVAPGESNLPDRTRHFPQEHDWHCFTDR